MSSRPIDLRKFARALGRLGSPTEELAVPEPRGPLPARVVGADLRVPLVSGGSARYVQLDYASSAPCLVAVLDAVERMLPWYGSVHRGAGIASTVTGEAYAAARESVGAFVGAREDDAIVFTRNTTDALNLLAAALPAGTEVITFASEHHANLLPWRRGRVAHLALPHSREDALSLADDALRSSIAPHRLLAVTGASNVTGEIWPIAELAAIAHRRGARIAVDAAQLAPHRPIDMAKAGIDYVALSGHKLYAPFGAGALVGWSDWLDDAPPYLAGGGAVKHVSIDGVEWLRGAARHEAGTPNVVGAIAMAAACDAMSDFGAEAMMRHEADLLDRLQRGLAAMDGAETISLWGADASRIGLVTFNLRGWQPAALSAALNAEFAIGVRDGAFCAHPLMDAITAERAAVRASFGVGTRVEDMERLLCALESLRDHGPRWRYRAEGGRFFPDPDPRIVPLPRKRGDRAVARRRHLTCTTASE